MQVSERPDGPRRPRSVVWETAIDNSESTLRDKENTRLYLK
jgi:hypothetical protein